MAGKSVGVVKKVKGKRVLFVTSAVAKGKFAPITKMLSTGKVDMIEVDLYGEPLCCITRAPKRHLRTGTIRL